MILIRGVNKIDKSTLEMDCYVIIRYRVGSFGRTNRVIGYLGSNHRKMVEIKIDRTSGEVYALTLLGVDEYLPYRGINQYISLPVQAGVPVVDLSDLTVEEPRDDGGPALFEWTTQISCGIAGRSIILMFMPGVPPTKLIDAEKGFFVLSDSMLVGFMTKELSSAQLDLFVDWAQQMTQPFSQP